jgi:pimeloyl-ACP methyl ester carboxylesterase
VSYDRPVKPGELLDDRFELDRVAGTGGMGVVYRAIDRHDGALAAIKLLRLDGADAERRFVREAETLATLRHPSVVTYLAHGRVGDELYLAMEWLEGEDLATRLAVAELTVEESLDVARQVAEALGAAHARGVVHRDVKPSNVFLVDWRLDRVKLIDFGVARRAGATTLTTTGMLVGTPVYMAPEQARGERDVDAGADVYALGTLLYRCLTGRLPFEGDSAAEVLARILADTAPRVRDLVPAIAPELDRLVARFLARDPARRPPDGAAAHAEIIGLGATAARWGRAVPAAPDVRHAVTRDGVRLAYASVGEGLPVVRVAHWLTHVEHDLRSPVTGPFLTEVASRHRLVRYDARGTGLSDREVGHVSFAAFLADLETVVDALELERFAVVGQSQGGAIAAAYAARHPERISHLVVVGGYARGWRKRSPESAAAGAAMTVLVRQGWGDDNPAFRQFFTSLFIPDATGDEMRAFNELARQAATPETAARILDALGDVDVTEDLPRVAAPALVFHSRHDSRAPFDEGARLAAAIPGARFVPLESRNHIILENEPAWSQLVTEVRGFLTGPES